MPFPRVLPEFTLAFKEVLPRLHRELEQETGMPNPDGLYLIRISILKLEEKYF